MRACVRVRLCVRSRSSTKQSLYVRSSPYVSDVTADHFRWPPQAAHISPRAEEWRAHSHCGNTAVSAIKYRQCFRQCFNSFYSFNPPVYIDFYAILLLSFFVYITLLAVTPERILKWGGGTRPALSARIICFLSFPTTILAVQVQLVVLWALSWWSVQFGQFLVCCSSTHRAPVPSHL